jgi:hypothetical protein
VQGRLKNHADPCDHGAEGDIEQEVQDVRPFIVAEHMRPSAESPQGLPPAF